MPSIMTDTKPQNLHILIVDDSILNQEITIDFIEDLGFSIDTANNGLEALDAVKKNTYSLILMDIHMPMMNGLDASKAIRQHEISLGIHPVPIIALTSDSTDGIKQRCSQSGMNDYLEKPFSQQDIYQKISRWLDQSLIKKSLANAIISPTAIDDNGAQILDAVEDIAQVSHWIWHINENRIHFSTYLQHYFEFPLRDIKTLDEYVSKIGHKTMQTMIDQCLSTRRETRWEQKLEPSETEQPANSLLHRFRVVICEDTCPVLIGTVQDISSIRRSEQHIMELAAYDSITGLSSRFRFNQQLEELIESAQRRASKFALLYVKLDDKPSENTPHYEPDEELLVEVANRLRKILRKSDFACRLVNNEFCLTINDIVDELSTMRMTERCLALFESPIRVADQDILLKANIGICIYPFDGMKATTLIQGAHTALDKALNSEDSQFAFFTSEMTAAAKNRQYIENDLHTALAEKQFELYYQPKVSLSSGEVNGIEAIIRWHHPDETLHLPDSFLPDIKRMGLAIDIGLWVIRDACQQIKQWEQQGLADMPVAINIAPQHFEQTGFAQTLFNIVNEEGISPALIELDLTESILQNQETFNQTCTQLRNYGFITAFDDFGTGYASLSELKGIAIDQLKIDKEFIRNLPNDTQSSIIVGTILGISNALGLRVVAEGVENEDQLKTLVAMGCHMAQGYYFSKPVPAKDIPELCKHNFRQSNILVA